MRSMTRFLFAFLVLCASATTVLADLTPPEPDCPFYECGSDNPILPGAYAFYGSTTMRWIGCVVGQPFLWDHSGDLQVSVINNTRAILWWTVYTTDEGLCTPLTRVAPWVTNGPYNGLSLNLGSQVPAGYYTVYSFTNSDEAGAMAINIRNIGQPSSPTPVPTPVWTPTPTPTPWFTHHLHPGWNSVAIPGAGPKPYYTFATAKDVIDDIVQQTGVEMIMAAFDNGRWRIYNPAYPVDYAINELHGYFLYNPSQEVSWSIGY